MDKKDLFKGLNEIDEELINEAMPDVEPKEITFIEKFNKSVKYIVPVAAAIALVLIGANIIGSDTIQNHQNNNGYGKANSEYVGIKSGTSLGSGLKAASNYEEFYDTLIVKKQNDNYFETETAEGTNGNTSHKQQQTTETNSLNNSKDDYSKTNLMTEGVDESDVVKTNGKFIYAAKIREISITDIQEGAPKESVSFKPSFVAPSDVIRELFVNNNQLLVISDHYVDNKEISHETYVYCYDISKGTEPEFKGAMKQDGYYYTSRKVDDIVYVFTSQNINKPALAKEEAVTKSSLSSWVPQVNDKSIASECIYTSKESSGGLLISSFNISDPSTIIDSKLVMNDYSNVYVSENTIYFYRNIYDERMVTEISRMGYSNGLLTVDNDNATSVGGSVMDSFAIREHNGKLFVLATENELNTNGRGVDTNTLHVFDLNLKQVGELSDIARDERVYAARFIGNYVYFITYRQTDPLFVADISDPTKPKILGELKVTGFSEYLHPWDENHILGIGYGDSVSGQNGRPIKLVMFDVTDPLNPKEENQLVIKNPGYYCEAMHNYKAILASPGKNLIGFAADKYYIYSYSKEKGFSVVTKENLKEEYTDGYRGLYVGDNIYVASGAEVIHVKSK